MSRRAKSPNGWTSDRQLRADDSTDDLRRYQECAKKLDECSKNLLRLCQVSGELNNLHDDDIERAANEIIRNEEEEAKKIAAELLHQKGLLHRNIQEPEVSASSYLNQDDCGSRPKSGGSAKSNAVPPIRRQDYEVPKTPKNLQEPSATDQRSHGYQQIINQHPYQILHTEERVPYPPQQYSSSGMSRPNPCTDYSSSQLKVPDATSTPNVTKVDGSERKGPPYFRHAQQQPPQSSWGRPEPVWNPAVTRKTDSSGLSNPRLLDQCAEQLRKMNDVMPSPTAESTKRGVKPKTIHLTAGTGCSADPPVHIVITAITNDSPCEHTTQQPKSYNRDPVYSDNEFAEESGYSLGNKATSTIYSSPTGDDRKFQKYFGSQENSYRDLKYQRTYDCPGQKSYPNPAKPSGYGFPSRTRVTEGDRMQPNPSMGYRQSNPYGPVKTLFSTDGAGQQTVKYSPNDIYGVGNRDQGMPKNVSVKRCYVPQPNSDPVDMIDSLRQYRVPTPPTVSRDRKNPCELKQFSVNPNQFAATPPSRGQEYQGGANPRVPGQPVAVQKTYQCTQICPPRPSPLSRTVDRTQSNSRIKATASDMDSSILLAIAKAAINLSLEKQREECEEDEYDDDCDSEYPDMLDTGFED